VTGRNKLIQGRVVEQTALLREKNEALAKSEAANASMLRDIRELNHNLEQRIAEEVQASRDKDGLLLQKNRHEAMGEMIGNIAHQWRQPLNTAALYVQDLEMAYQAGEVDGKYVAGFSNNMMDVIQTMSNTIDDFRDFFRPNRSLESFSVEESVMKAVSFLAPSFKHQNIRLEFHIGTAGRLVGSANEYSQVVLNLLNNARDQLLRSNGERLVDIALDSADGHQIVRISDTGGGIPEPIIGRIFDPYFSTKGPTSGTGIGLFMSRTIIETNMGGKLQVRNVELIPGVPGAEFTIIV